MPAADKTQQGGNEHSMTRHKDRSRRVRGKSCGEGVDSAAMDLPAGQSQIDCYYPQKDGEGVTAMAAAEVGAQLL